MESGTGLGSLDAGVGGLEAACANDVRRTDCFPSPASPPASDASFMTVVGRSLHLGVKSQSVTLIILWGSNSHQPVIHF